MAKPNFKLECISAYDRERLTCEITYHEEIIAEITQETGELRIEIYKPLSERSWTVPLIDFQTTLDRAIVFLREESGVEE